jgi:hypothetical protein
MATVGCFPWVKGAGRAVGHSPPSIVGVKNERDLYSPMCCHGVGRATVPYVLFILL